MHIPTSATLLIILSYFFGPVSSQANCTNNANGCSVCLDS